MEKQLHNKVKLRGAEWVQNEISIDGVKYLETIKPIMKDDQVKEFIYTFSSLQPITKATNITRYQGGFTYLSVRVIQNLVGKYSNAFDEKYSSLELLTT